MNERNLKFWESKECIVCGVKFWSLIKRNQKSCSAKCSGVYVASQPDRMEKIKQTNLKKYGCKAPSQNKDISEKAKQTCLEKYGVDNASKSKEVIEKIKSVNQEKYGVDWSWQSKDVQEKIKKTNLERYGVENPGSCDLIKEKVKDTNLERYGVENPFQNKNVQKKIKQFWMGSDNCDHPSKSDRVKEIKRKKQINLQFKKFVDGDRLQGKVIPLFKKEEYTNSERCSLYKFKCCNCNNEFEDHLDNGNIPRCLKCYPKESGRSDDENEIYTFLCSIHDVNNIKTNDRTILEGKELDFYIPLKNLAIEFDGIAWHSDDFGGKERSYHINKTNDCYSKGIKLIHIFEDEWILKKEIVKSKIKHILGINTEFKIYARKCIIKEIESSACKEFLEKYHLQGYNKSSIRLGAFFNDELVAVMTFGKLRASLGNKTSEEGSYEMYRFCVNRSIIGIAGKLFQYFVRNHNPLKVITFADKRYSGDSSFYEKIGFRLISNTDPNYWYFKLGYLNRYHRYTFRKQVLKDKLENFDPTLTEWQNMKNHGYDRIWDCGNIKYEWKNPNV